LETYLGDIFSLIDCLVFEASNQVEDSSGSKHEGRRQEEESQFVDDKRIAVLHHLLDESDGSLGRITADNVIRRGYVGMAHMLCIQKEVRVLLAGRPSRFSLQPEQRNGY
jgi:hypothetical protein